jgi:hypothetical protein
MPGRHFAQVDLSKRHQLPPRLVLPEERGHPRRGVNRDTVGAQDLAAQVHESRVVADVGVRQQDSVDRSPRVRDRAAVVERLDLRGDVGRGVDEVAQARDVVDEAKAGHPLPPRRVAAGLDAQRLPAADVRDAAVLGNTQDDGADGGWIGRGRHWR